MNEQGSDFVISYVTGRPDRLSRLVEMLAELHALVELGLEV